MVRYAWGREGGGRRGGIRILGFVVVCVASTGIGRAVVAIGVAHAGGGRADGRERESWGVRGVLQRAV